MKTETLFSSRSDEWETPQDLFDQMNAEFDFQIDACATAENKKCLVYFDKDQDGLSKSWGGCRVWCNPPYSNVLEWVRKAFLESREDGTIVCMLLPARTDTKWFQQYVLHRAEVRFLNGRLRFSGAKENAPFPSMIVIYRGPGG